MKAFLVIILMHLSVISYSQANAYAIKASLQSEKIKDSSLVLAFYQLVQYKLVWINQPSHIAQLDTLIVHSGQWGLNQQLYASQRNGIRKFMEENKLDTLLADIRFTLLAISLFRELRYGEAPSVGYAGLSYKPDCNDIPSLLAKAVSENSLEDQIGPVQVNGILYKGFRNEMERMIAIPDSCGTMKYLALVKAINTARWLNCLLRSREKIIIVNIPSATLGVYGKDSLLLASKVIVGKRSTPTPILTSEVTEIVLYPYWMVPHKIASRELLPMIKKHSNYLEQNNFQVLDRSGRIIDPATINWQTLSAENFPYTLRQSTGCDNSLGLIKLELYSPYTVYLHDTPWKILFLSPERFFSHGCIRVERTKELARSLLEDQTMAMDTVLTDNPPASHDPVHIKLPSPVPVLILYNTAWPDSTGQVRYYRDIYNKLPKIAGK